MNCFRPTLLKFCGAFDFLKAFALRLTRNFAKAFLKDVSSRQDRVDCERQKQTPSA